mgnify:CR=1 FL=1
MMNEAEHERASIVAWMRDPDRSDWATLYMAKAMKIKSTLLKDFYCAVVILV